MSAKESGGGMGTMMAMLTGAAIGAGVALLFAPKSGKDTREWLAHRTRTLKDTTTRAYAQGMDAIQRATKDGAKDQSRPNPTPMRG